MSHSMQALSSDWVNDLERLIRDRYPLAGAADTTPTVCLPILDFAVKNIGCPLAEVWSVDPRHRRLIRIARVSACEMTCPYPDLVDFDVSLTGLTVESAQIRFFANLELQSGVDGRVFRNTEILDFFKLVGMLSIPIRNSANPHQVLLVLNFFVDEFVLGAIQSIDLSGLKVCAKLLATTVEAHLRERTFRESTEFSARLSAWERLTESTACKVLAEVVCEAIAADSVTVFLEHPVGPKLLRQADVSFRCASRGGTPEDDAPSLEVIDVWKTNRERLIPFPHLTSDSEDSIGDAVPIPCTAVVVPLHDVKGLCKGVVSAVRWSAERPRVPHFTYDDVAIIESIGQSFRSPLDALLDAKRRDVSLQKLTHELRVPMVAFQAIIERMEHECITNKWQFRFRHFHEANIYVDLMNRLLDEVTLARIGPSGVRFVKQLVNLETAVIVPAIRFTSPLLIKKQINPAQLIQRGFENLPEIEIDPGLMIQIVFNLLENAIKYYTGNAAEFNCSISGKRVGNVIEISVKDYGDGISVDDAGRIFNFGFRGTIAERTDVQGAGLGLWIAHGIAERHAGSLELRHLKHPTEFVLTLPLR